MSGLSLRNIYYERQYRWVLENVNVELSAQQLLFVSGNNGSGKTSLLRIVSGLVMADRGDVLWNGQPISKSLSQYHHDICYVGHKDGIKDDLTVTENIQLMRALVNTGLDSYTKQRDTNEAKTISDYLDAVGLSDEHAMAASLSAGQKRRLALSRCLIGQRKLWILDEPFTALDQGGIRLFQQHLSQHLDVGGMAIMASHQMVDLPGNRVMELNLNQ